ncbi:MAG: signal peptide peptidase SppA [Deltaproteobacteria bacterium]|nr:signal peptide peptidase SppA [Deltaproteobacteria bacterium]
MRTLAAASVIVGVASSGCVFVDLRSLLSSPGLHEVVIEDHEADAKVALVTITGPMDAENPSGFLTQEQSIVASTKEQLEAAAADPDVRAVILKVSSPGGAIYPSMAIHREVLRFKERTKKPVVAYTPDVAASGGYMVAVAADEIVSDPAAITGSIGVLAIHAELSGLAEWAHVSVETFKTGKRKDVGNPFRKMTDEDRAEIDRFIQYYFATFKKIVDEGRATLDATKVEALADGGVFHAEEALKNGIVDAVGDFYDAWERAARRAGSSAGATNLVAFRQPGKYSGSIYASSAQPRAPTLSVDLGALTRPGPRLEFMYLWMGD